jgi:hypothetical protein
MSWTDRGQDKPCTECGHERWEHGLSLGKTVTQPCRGGQGEWRGIEVECECKDFKRSYGRKDEVQD